MVWFSNPSKEAARARREEAKEIMGRELWSTIMEDSSEDDDEEEEEEFFFYDGGWHSSPQSRHVHLEPRNEGDGSYHEEVDYSQQGLSFEVDEDTYDSAKDVVCLENSSHSANNTTTVMPVCVSETHKSLDRSDINANESRHHGLETVEEAPPKSDEVVVVGIESSPDDKDARNKLPEKVERMAAENDNTVVAVTFEQPDTQAEQSIELDDDDAAVSVNYANMELMRRMTEKQTKSAVVVEIDMNEAEEESLVDVSNQIVAVSQIESVFESNEQLGGFKRKIRNCWTKYVGHKIRGWSAKIRRALTPCCIDAHTQAEHNYHQRADSSGIIDEIMIR